MMDERDWRDRAPIRALQSGAVLGVIGMIAGQIAQDSSTGQVIFMSFFSLFFGAMMWLLALGGQRRLRATGTDRLPEREPRRLLVIGLMLIAILMWLMAGYGAFIAVLWGQPADGWHAVAYASVALCASGATMMMRQSRQEWLAHYRRDWPSKR